MDGSVTSESDRVKEARRRIKDNFASPESTITQPEASQRPLFVLNVSDCSMHELNSLFIRVPINLRYSFTVIIVNNMGYVSAVEVFVLPSK